MVRAWKEHGAIPLQAKISAILVMTLSAIFVVFFSGAPLWAVGSALALMLVGATYLLTRPTLRAEISRAEPPEINVRQPHLHQTTIIQT